MFVLCPSCAGPFRIPADQIAPLVQIACPHCEFRMILDFEAANEPSLAEPGQLFAQGFESAEAYFSVYSHVGPQSDITPRTVEAPARPVEVETPAVKAPPTSPAATPPVSVQTPATPPVSAPPTPVAPAAEPVSRGNKTIIQAPKRPASMDPRAGDVASAPASSGPSMRAGGRAAEVEPVAEAKVSAVQPEPRIPPHTPPAATAVSNPPPPSELAVTPKVEDIAAQSGSHPPTPKQEAISKPAEPEKKPVATTTPPTGSSNVVYIALVLVVIVAIVVVVYLNSKG